MLIEKDTFDKEKFMQLFNKSFSNYAEKSPLFLRYKIVENEVYVYDFSRNPEQAPLKFPLDYEKDTKANIKVIKDYLVEHNYPHFFVREIKTRPLNTFEIQHEMEKNRISFKDASIKTITVVTNEKEYRLEKVFNLENRICVRELHVDKEAALYELRIPVTIFMQEVFSNEENAAQIFVTKSNLIKYMPDVNR